MKKIPRVLLVDDDKAANFLNKDIITSNQFAEEVIVKSDGRDALAYLEKECKVSNHYPNLILLDLRMPGFTGFEFLKEFNRICKDVRHDMYVAILTISRDGDDIIKVRNLGHYDWIEKPLTIEKLMDLHHKYFREKMTH